MNNLIISFDDMESINLHNDLSNGFRNGLLTDVSKNPLADTDYCYKFSTSFHDYKECIPFACNFNLPYDHHKNVTTNKLSKKTGTLRAVSKKVFTKDLLKPLQWDLMTQLIESWKNRLHKQSWLISNAEIYGEFTAQGLIHAHGLVHIVCCSAYAMGVSTIIAKEWIKMTKGSMASLAKKNALGKYDYAFAKCSDSKAFLKYASKGPGKQAEEPVKQTEITPNICDNQVDSEDSVQEFIEKSLKIFST